MGFICQICHINPAECFYADDKFMILCYKCKKRLEENGEYHEIIHEDEYYRNRIKNGDD